jgi:phenylacetic acid degradation protein
MIYEFNGYRPVVDESAFVHPQAAVTGNVIIGKNVYIGPGAAIRGDWGEIIIKDGCNVQENCTIHMFPGVTVVLEESAHIGHGAIIHGARIGRNSLVGMNAVIMDNAVIGENCIVGALCFVPADTVIPDRKVVVGNPAKIVKDVSDEMVEWKTEGTKLYQQLPQDCYASLIPCEPLRSIPENRPKQADFYKPRTSKRDSFILHVITKKEWELALAEGSYAADSLEKEGFIHCSMPDQILQTLEVHYKDKNDILLLVINPKRLDAPLKFELAPKRNMEFPHIYGRLNLSAVEKFYEVPEKRELLEELLKLLIK